MVYYGLSLNSSNLGGNDYINFFISGAVEFPAYLFCQLTLHYIGRRWSLAGTMIVGGISLLCILAVPKGEPLMVYRSVTKTIHHSFASSILSYNTDWTKEQVWRFPLFVLLTDLNVVTIVLAMIGKFCISASFAIIYVFSAELFPTVVRNVGVGSGSFWARVGGIVAPYIGSLVSPFSNLWNNQIIPRFRLIGGYMRLYKARKG